MSTLGQGQSLEISVARPEERHDALALVYRELIEPGQADQVESLVGPAAAEPSFWEGLLVARRDGVMVGAALSQIVPGRAASVWLPRCSPGEPAATAAALLKGSAAWLAGQPVRIAQCLLRLCSPEEEAALKEAKFRRLAQLFYLFSEEKDFPHSAPETGLRFQPYSSSAHARLRRIVEASYEKTLDCPALNGVRTAEDVLAGYRASGAGDTRHWFLISSEGRDVGCLILADYPEQQNMELVYMAILPEARGHGGGLEIARYAQWVARQTGRARLVLAVDAKNRPAIRIYAAAGFRAWDRRTVYVRIFAPPPHADPH